MPKYVVYGILFVVGLLVACSSLGTEYVPIKTIPEGQALVYILYPESKAPGSDARAKSPIFTVSESGKPIVTVEKGGYYPYFVKPGELTLTSKLSFKLYTSGALDVALAPENNIQLQIDPGQTYYLEVVPLHRSDILLGVWELKFNQIFDELQAQLMLEECKLLPKYKPPPDPA
jgi:hypothetical protein